MNKIWQRYFFKETGKVFVLFLFCFYGLYILIDYATHANQFYHTQSFAWDEFILYYVSEFIYRSDVLIPFALMIATIRTLTVLNINNELTALRAAGLSLYTLTKPFIFIGLMGVILLYTCEEWLMPISMAQLKKTKEAHALHKRKSQHHLSAQHLVLQDDTILIFQSYDAVRTQFFDAYWIVSPEKIYRIKFLQPFMVSPLGKHVDLLERDEQGNFSATSYFIERLFPEMVFNRKMLLETTTQLEDLSISKLWERWPSYGRITSDKEAQVVTAFYYKLIAPWLCLFAVLAPLPMGIRFSRNTPVYLIYALNIFSLVVIYLILDSAQVLGKKQAITPALAIFGPFGLFTSLFAWRHYTLR